jgi:uncharacterized RDD family membrane protein YckC
MTDAPTPRVSAGLLRRLAALVYDTLLLVAVWMAATAAWLGIAGGTVPDGLWWPFRAYLLVVAFGFLGGFWVHAGRTLGMQAWRLRVVDRDGHPLDWRQAAWRFSAAALSLALLGGGFLWALIDRDGLTLHDRLSATRVVLVPRS